MNLIYYYPIKDGAPSNVARNIFNTLYNKRSELPFDEIIIYTDPKYKSILEKKFKGIKIFGMKETFKISKRDIVHIPVSPLVFPNAKFLLHSFCSLNKNKLILNYHGDLRTEIKLKYKSEKKIEFTNLPTYLLIPSLLTSANIIVVNSYFLKEVIVNQYKIKSIEVIPNAVENYWFSENNEYLGKNVDRCEVFYHGRLSPEKGVELLIKGFYEFLSEKMFSKEVILYIAGNGSQKDYLESLSKKLKIDKYIVFLGNIDKDQIKSHLKRVNGAIYPSIWDNFPLSILEALASASCPVFFSRKAGIYDFVTEEYDLNTFNPDLKSISDIFHQIFENRVDRKIVKRQKKFAEKYTWDKVIDNYIKLYNNVINE